MAKKRNTKQEIAEKTKLTCRECAHSTDWAGRALDGHLILCKCKYYKDGKFFGFLSTRQCAHFKLRKNASTEKSL